MRSKIIVGLVIALSALLSGAQPAQAQTYYAAQALDELDDAYYYNYYAYQYSSFYGDPINAYYAYYYSWYARYFASIGYELEADGDYYFGPFYYYYACLFSYYASSYAQTHYALTGNPFALYGAYFSNNGYYSAYWAYYGF